MIDIEISKMGDLEFNSVLDTLLLLYDFIFHSNIQKLHKGYWLCL